MKKNKKQVVPLLKINWKMKIMENNDKEIKFVVDKKSCAGCGGCIQACPYDANSYENDGKVS